MNNLKKPITKAYRTLALAGLVAGAIPFHASAINIILEAGALGFANSAINDGSTVDPDIAGKLVTSPTVGQGSVLTVQTDGKAGPGTVANPLLVTITANTHLDTPLNGDYQSGVIYMTSSANPLNPTDRGLGVRAFTVNTTTGMRLATGAIEGSKEVSGGTDTSATDHNGAPHVDELVDFNFAQAVLGQSIVVTLTKFDGLGTSGGGLNGSQDIFDIVVHRSGGADIVLNSVTSSSFTGLVTPTAYTDVWNINFSHLPGLLATDIVTEFTIRANDDNPSNPAGTAEHFLIDGLVVNTSVPDAGSTLGLMGIGLAMLAAAKRKFLA
jgi:hypothetical protein